MKDWHWLLVFGSILITPFLPALMKAKCPGCNKRKLNSLDTVRDYTAPEGERIYKTFYRCDACLTYFNQANGKTLQASSAEEFERAVRESQAHQPVHS